MSVQLPPDPIITQYNQNSYSNSLSNGISLTVAQQYFVQLSGSNNITGALISSSNFTLTNPTSILTISGTTASTSNITGCLILAGGIGISNTTNATSITNGGTLTSAGGGAFAKSLYTGGLNVNTANTISLTSTNLTSGVNITSVTNANALNLINGSQTNCFTSFLIPASGGLSLSAFSSQTLNTWNLDPSFNMISTSTTDASSTTSLSSFKTAGGISCAKSIYANTLIASTGGITSNGNITSTGTTTALILNGSITSNITLSSSTAATLLLSSAISAITMSGATSSVLTISSNTGYLTLTGSGTYINIANTTASTSSGTGALQCAGGAYFGNNSLSAGVLTIKSSTSQMFILNQTNSANLSAMNFITDNQTYELGVRGSTSGTYATYFYLYNGNFLYTITPGGIFNLLNNTNATSSTNGSMALVGGLSVAQDIYTAGNLTITGSISGATTIGCSGVITNTNSTQATNISSGSVILSGGIGIAKSIYNAGFIVNSNTSLASAIGAAVNITSGGIKSLNCYLGGTLNFDGVNINADGILLNGVASTLNDSTSSANATVVRNNVFSIYASTLTATNANVTVTNSCCLYISGPNTAGSNVSITNGYTAIFDGQGCTRFVCTTTASTPTSNSSIRCAGDIALNGKIYSNSAANVQQTNTLWTLASDERIKENVENANDEICWSNMKQLRIKYFKWKDGINTESSNRHSLGVIAQEYEKIHPKDISGSTHYLPDQKNINLHNHLMTTMHVVRMLQLKVEELQLQLKK